jgi:hypothetical protein
MTTTETEPYDPKRVIVKARFAAYTAVGLTAQTTASLRYANATDAALGVVADALIARFEGAMNPNPDEDDEFSRGYGEALDWVCRELDALKEAR